MAYFVVLLPLVIMLKVPMIVFSLIVITILYFKREPAGNLLVFSIFVLGLVALYLSLYGAFSFRGLSRLKLFLELLVYILIIVVSMQRLTRKINFYLLISPFLFLALSLFFYHGIVMLSYVIFEVFFLLWMVLSHRMEGNILEGFRSSMVMFMYSLPWVVVLFIFFPRISFEHADYGFKGEVTKRMGHDGTMFLDGNALLVPSERIVMEVSFQGKVPEASQLYFRGSILYIDKKDHWEALPEYSKRKNNVPYVSEGKNVHYNIILYPTQKRWLYMLDMPESSIENSTLDRDLISTVSKNIEEPLHYFASSSLSPTYTDKLDDVTYTISTKIDTEQNPQTYKVMADIKKNYPTDRERIDAVKNIFKTQALTYTLNPDALDTNHTTDSFLYDKRRGYCVHFAAAFATSIRMLGIPSRIVTGYKSSRENTINNYLIIREKDAHAWIEVYLDTQWQRVETTALATYIDEIATKTRTPYMDKINTYLLYVKYKIETWILYYSHVRQLQLLDYAKKNPSFVFGFILSLITLLILSFIIIAYFRRPTYSSKALAIIQPLLKSLKKQSYVRESNESIHQFLLRYTTEHPEQTAVKEVDALYEELLYGVKVSKEKHTMLQKKVKQASSLI